MSPEGSSRLVVPASLVLVGMMGAGKSSVGRRLAARLSLPFFDVDDEIVKATHMSVVQVFADYGESEFRRLEERIIARLLDGPIHVLSTGGGAIMNAHTRALIRSKAISIWLKADLDILMERSTRRDDRPMLHGGNPREKMIKLLTERTPVYEDADITIESDTRPIDKTVDRIMAALDSRLNHK
jgi:shikimate kinase